MNRKSLLARLLLAVAIPAIGSAQVQSNALYRWDPSLAGIPYTDIYGAPQRLVIDLNTGYPIVDYLGISNWANSPQPRLVTTNVITPTPVGNALQARAAPTDGAANVLVVSPAAVPAGSLTAFQTFVQPGSESLPFQAYVLRPTATPGTYSVAFDSGVLTTPATAGVATYPLAAPFAVLAGDLIAHYGQGVPFDMSAGGVDPVYYPAAAAPVVGVDVALGGASYPAFDPAAFAQLPRTYSFGASVDVVTGTTTALQGGMRKFVDGLPGLSAAAANNLGQYLPVAVADTTTYPGSDYYVIEVGEYQEQLHSDLPPTRLRGYRQLNTTDATVSAFHYLGPVIVAQKDHPVRIKFVNSLPTGAGGNLWLPVDESVMGAGTGPLDASGAPCDNSIEPNSCAKYTQNRATLHLHGGHTPWISDGTPHQWITPASEVTPFKKGVSVYDVPDMEAQADGSQTFYWTNQQSARLMFYHDHAYGITRLNVYAGEAAGYVITDAVEQELVANGVLPGAADTIPLIIQDKTFVDASAVYLTDPSWRWGTGAPVDPDGAGPGVAVPSAVTGDLWYPHIYVPAQNPYDLSGANPFGRWHYGPWFWPPTTGITHPPVSNPYYQPIDTRPFYAPFQAPEMPAVPNPSTPGESFFDVAMVNGTAYPSVTVDPKAMRFRILNAANDRFWNLQLYVAADKNSPTTAGTTGAVLCNTPASVPQNCTEVKMLPAASTAVDTTAFPTWPVDGREGGVPDPTTMGPSFIQFATEGGLLPAPVVVENQPIAWNANPTTFNFGNVNAHALLVAPAERADVVVDFSAYAGQTLILYNDAPAAFPALDNRYDYYTGAPNLVDAGGIAGVEPGYGPNIRTIMQIVVRPALTTPASTFTLAGLQAAFASTPGSIPPNGAFARAQDPVIVAQGLTNGPGYESAYGQNFPTSFPYWGISRIGDTSVGFQGIDGTLNPPLDPVTGLPPPIVNGQVAGAKVMEPKAIQDEMGEVFDPDYGRMSSRLGLELRNTNAQNQNFVVQTYTDAPTEIIQATLLASPTTDNVDAQIWKITHNGVDTHPVHFHLFEVQLLNRVGWDGAIRLPDANELGWKDTIRISPLEDTIVALRFVAPKTPFGVPFSTRPMSPATPLGSPMGLSLIDPFTGQPLVPPPVNSVISFGWEYVWHCHILSHEEMDMMRAVTVLPAPAPALATPPVLAALALDAGGLLVVPAALSWTDATPVVDPFAPANFGNPQNEVGFRILRSDNDGPFAVIGQAPANAVTFTDTTATATGYYKYQVVAFNAAGDSGSNIQTVGQPVDVVPPTLTWGALSPAANVRGWNNTPVNVLFTATDNLSGVASVALAGNPAVTFTSPPGAVISTQGLAQTVTVTVTDGAVPPNSANFTSPARNIDLTPPTLTVTRSPVSRPRGNGTSGVAVSGTVSDALSGILALGGVNEGTYTITSDKPALPGNDLTGTFNVAANGAFSFSRAVSRVNTGATPRIWTITVRAPDRAGNIGIATTTYTVF